MQQALLLVRVLRCRRVALRLHLPPSPTLRAPVIRMCCASVVEVEMSVLQRMFALLLAVAALAYLATSSVVIVDQRQYGMVYGAGRLQRLLQEPGLQFKWPWPVQELRTLDRRILVTTGDTGSQPLALAQSGTQRSVPLSWYVQWHITNPQHYVQHVGDTSDAGAKRLNDTLRAALQTELAHAGHFPLDAHAASALQQKLVQQLRTAAQQSGQPWGLQVLDVRILRQDIEQKETEAAQARMNQALQQTAARLKAEAASAAVAAQAEAENQRDALLAAGRQQAQHVRDEGQTQALRIYAADHAQNPQLANHLRALAVYRKSFGHAGDVLVIDAASNSYLQHMREGSGKPPAIPASASTSAPASAPASAALPATAATAASAPRTTPSAPTP